MEILGYIHPKFGKKFNIIEEEVNLDLKDGDALKPDKISTLAIKKCTRDVLLDDSSAEKRYFEVIV